MDQSICDHLASNDIPKTLSLIIFQIKPVRKMLPSELHHLFIAFDQICFYDLTIIIPVHIDPAEQSVCHICRCNICDHIIFSKQHDSSQIKPRLPSHAVHTIKPRALQQFFICHTAPRMGLCTIIRCHRPKLRQ